MSCTPPQITLEQIGLEAIDETDFNILFNDEGDVGNLSYDFIGGEEGNQFTLKNEFLVLAQGSIDHNASSIINQICGDNCLAIGNVVKLHTILGFEGIEIDEGPGNLQFIDNEEEGIVGFIEPDPDVLLPKVSAVNSLGEAAYGIVVGGDFEGVYEDGTITLDQDTLGKGVIAAFFEGGVRVCTKGRCLAIADGTLTGEINVGDDLMASANGLVKALLGAPIIARALQSATKVNSIIAVDVQRINGTGGFWVFKKQLTVDAADVTGASPLTDFPLLVSITDTDLKDNARLDGFDIFFTASDGVTRIPFERESYDPTTGTLIAWVLTDLSDTVDTNLFMFYGNPKAPDQQDAAPVWAARSFFDVFHFNQTVFPWVNSASGQDFNVNEGSTTSVPLSGQIGTSASINSSTVKFSQEVTTPKQGSDFYISLWLKYDSVGAFLMDHFISSPIAAFLTFRIRDITTTGFPNFSLFEFFGALLEVTLGDATDLLFHHVAVRFTSSTNTYDFFFDGIKVDTVVRVPAGLTQFDPSSSGDDAGGDSDGRIDEIQFADNSNFSDGFVKTSFDNQTMQGADNFVKVGPQESSN